jgi:xylan 1,4-beta-xylosidase
VPVTDRSKSNLAPILWLPGFLLLSLLVSAQESVTIQVDASISQGPIKTVWTYFGYDEPNYTYAPHGRELITELTALTHQPVYIRTHNLLTTGDGTPALKWGSTNAYTEDAAGNPVYDWTIVDKILDTYIHAGAKPFVELGFMPEAMSTHPEPYRHHWPKDELYVGWAYPPKEFKKWGELIYQLTLHCIRRYGKAEAESWYWEVWNEPNIGYWHGTPEEYNRLYDYAVDGVRRALPKARVGGPATTGPGNAKAADYLKQFLEHCARGKNNATGKTGAPLDFITFHAKGQPKVVEGRIQMGLAANLRDTDEGFKIVASFPRFAKLPIILSESDPEGCAACSAHGYPQNAYRNGALYPAYTATSIRNMLDLADRYHSNFEGFLTWAFEFENQPFFDGFRTLATNGVDKPILNLFRMLGLMEGQRIKTESSSAVGVDKILQSGVREHADVDTVAARGGHNITVLAWNYHDDDLPAADVPLHVKVNGVPLKSDRMLLRHYRIDRDHSNAFTVWKEMGSPQSPTAEQYARLKAAGQLQLLESPRWINVTKGTSELEFLLPGHALSLLEIEW